MRGAKYIVDFYSDAQAIVFVIDSNDDDSLARGVKELQILENNPSLRNTPVLVFANKQDLPNSKSGDEISTLIANAIGASSHKRPWTCVECTATKGEGLRAGFQWIEDYIDGKIVFDDPKILAGEEAHTIATTSSDVSTSGSVDEIVYDPENNTTLERFSTIKQGANCPFAKAAKLWGGPDTGENASLEDQARSIAPQLALFVGKINEGEPIDGFCIELVDSSARNGGPKELGEAVRKMLSSLSELDPLNENMMQVNFVGSRGWRMRFAGEDFFVTSFSPAYPSTSSRYAFGSPHAFLLLQPEKSFARHRLPDDTADTNWEAPKTIRDKTRVAYKEAGRPYHIPVTIEYPPAEHIVKPLNDDGRNESVVRWWTKPMRT
mmetsp:Transcript_17613/g.38511  ORF Transcript_17613/g.38511 Transcript_17613/m.38511 type:complete len:378 (-) Transcript_17613:81-1214(-)|eukprot:CAMPEP_0178688110 /NCGR_PEP_ID=MMETSP0699-20121125/4815_1 /TAXON_ID=265572 /ORGANISM="Extubocellulus spinifer, Strain CCMP396" /LENGTH=377 /DNA_ID=CAMNT_0020333055 /DNA_START=514 /DNA_END=1647 /DNA_ORIENTATION=+